MVSVETPGAPIAFAELIERARASSAGAADAGPWSFEDLRARHKLYEAGGLLIAYAPVDHVNLEAEVVVLGITPGLRQAQLAFETHRDLEGARLDVVGREVKRRAAFAGSMRKNLASMLNDLKVHQALGVTSTEVLFSERSDLVHSTSALRYPVFKDGRNYSGYSPEPTRHHVLRWMLENVLAPELLSVPEALVVPLGGAVERSLDYLTSRGFLPETKWLRGFPHPSGANGHRKRSFAENRPQLVAAVERWAAKRRPVSGSPQTMRARPFGLPS